MKVRFSWNRIAQWVVVLACALAIKQFYSTASADQLRWILAPTTALVALVSDTSFEFESHAGYISGDHSFLIAPSCAGVNFLITAFLMLSVAKLVKDRSGDIAWRFIPAAGLVAYLVTLAANTVRIAIALRMGRTSDVTWLDPRQLHRVEGIIVYFGFLMLLFAVSERLSPGGHSALHRQSLLPLLVYYATTLGIPVANGAYRQGTAFWEYSIFVLLIPLLFVMPIAVLSFYRRQTSTSTRTKAWAVTSTRSGHAVLPGDQDRPPSADVCVEACATGCGLERMG